MLPLPKLLLALGACCLCSCSYNMAQGGSQAKAQGEAQSFAVDFSISAGPPLVKTKFGVYQTPLVTLPRLLKSLPLLREINVRDLRYEIGWGKPDVLAFDQISGTPQQLRYDFSSLDAIARGLEAVDVRPLFAMTYCPLPLQTRAGWPGWKDAPSNLDAWEKINRDYAARLKPSGAGYEIWNEPDMPDPGGKMFFSGGPQDYAPLYAHAARGLRAADADAAVGGAAIAFDTRYFDGIREQPLDFASIHAYDNYGAQIDNLRGALGHQPQVPIFLTEYASFTDLPANGPQSRHEGAMRFFRDVKGLLSRTDVTKVYWAQWLDAGQAPGMGLMTWDGHRKALFNAFKLYGQMPVDRNQVLPERADGLSLLASSNEQRATVALWNEGDTDRSATLNLSSLPFANSTMKLYRIDKGNASFVDDPAHEDLQPVEEQSLRTRATSWTGIVPARSVAFLLLDKTPADVLAARRAPAPSVASLGRVVRLQHWFFDRGSDAYADFDEPTWTAREGMGSRDFAVSQMGALIDHPARQISVQVLASGPLRKLDPNSVLGLRVDFPSFNGSYSRSVLLHGGLYDAQRNSQLPWGKGGAVPDQARLIQEISTGRPFTLNLSKIAPPDWNGQRVLLTFLMQNAGRGSQAKWTLKPVS